MTKSIFWDTILYSEWIIILLVGGDKSSQSDDIKKAKALLSSVNEILKELDNE